MHEWVKNFFPMSGWPVALIILVTQFLASYIVNLLSYKNLNALYPLYRTRKFEKNGNIYQTVFRIKDWKDYIPSVSSFDKKNMKARLTPEYVSQFLLEGVRAELCHDLAIIFAVVILFCSIPSAWFFIIVYTLLLNIPCILIQRYNRPRFERLIRNKDSKGHVILVPFWIKNGKAQSAHEEKIERHEKQAEAKAERKTEKAGDEKKDLDK